MSHAYLFCQHRRSAHYAYWMFLQPSFNITSKNGDGLLVFLGIRFARIFIISKTEFKVKKEAKYIFLNKIVLTIQQIAIFR